jgi:glycosyltransferase involved in cell wall biosynthesis
VTRLNILHVIPTLDPRSGGPPLIAARLAAQQAVLGHRVGVMTYQSRDDGRARIKAENEKLAGFDRVTIYPLPFITRREQWTGRDAKSEALRLVPDADVVHVHGVWESQLRVTAAVARRVGRPYLVLLNGMLFPWSMRRSRWKKRLALATGVRRMLDGGTLHFGSADERDAAAALGFTGPGVILPNGVNPDEFASPPPPGTFRRAHPELGDDPYVLFLGRLHEQKGVDLLPAALFLAGKINPRIRLVIAGPDYGQEASLRREIATALRPDQVSIVGPLYGSTKQAALVDAACFVLPSRLEGFSMAILESMALGTPVVISANCHFPEVAAAGAGVVTPLDVTHVAAAMAGYTTDPAARAAASAAAKNLVFTHYTWDAIARRSIEIYQSAGRPA